MSLWRHFLQVHLAVFPQTIQSSRHSCGSPVWNICLLVELWTVGNYHWYLKQNLEFAASDRVETVQWDTEQAYRLRVVTSSGQYLQYTWAWTTSVSQGSVVDDQATVGVIDGGKYWIESVSRLSTRYDTVKLYYPMRGNLCSVFSENVMNE